MAYDKTLIAENGEEFPYSESFDNETYYYHISIVSGRDRTLLTNMI